MTDIQPLSDETSTWLIDPESRNEHRRALVERIDLADDPEDVNLERDAVTVIDQYEKLLSLDEIRFGYLNSEIKKIRIERDHLAARLAVADAVCEAADRLDNSPFKLIDNHLGTLEREALIMLREALEAWRKSREVAT